jgi:dynein heavy chain, axonemal
MIQNLVRESIKEYFELYVDHTLRNPVLFGDFRNALTHNTDQRYYEDLLDFEAVFFLFQEVI